MNEHDRLVAECRALAPDFTIGEETLSVLNGASRVGKACDVQVVMARCTIGGLPHELHLPVDPGAGELLLAECLRYLKYRDRARRRAESTL